MNLTRTSFVLGASAAAATVAMPQRANAAGELRVAFIPEVATTTQSIAEKQPFIDYFAHATGATVKLIIPTNYAATVEAMGNGSVDIAYFGGLTYLKASERYGAEPLVQREEDRHFHSLFITGSPEIKTLKDVKGKTFAFGDISSTSGHLIPVLEFKTAGIDPDRDFTARFSGNHTNTAIAVASGQVAAGALDETVYRKLVADKTIDESKARVFFTSRPFVDYVWAYRKDLDPAMVAKVRNGFLTMTDPKVLGIMRASKYVVAKDSEYAVLRETARSLNLL